VNRRGWGLLIAGTLLVGGALIGAVGADRFAPSDPEAIRLADALLSPSAEHWMGTDQLGRDLFSRMLHGARVSMRVGVGAIGIATAVGLLIGGLAGLLGGRWDGWIMRLTDVMLCFPTIFLILAAVAFLDNSEWNIILIIGLTGWMGVARLTRAEVLSLREREFILAARAAGAGPARILFRHLIPNALGPVIVSAALGVGTAILIESGLSFLGLGIQPPTPSWGNILTEGKETLGAAWWLTLFPGLAIFFVVLGCNLLGEGLRRRWRSS